MSLDSEPREFSLIPPDLAVAELTVTPRALAAFNAITPSLRRHLVAWIDKAKQSKTRDKRIQFTVKKMVERARKKAKEEDAKKVIANFSFTKCLRRVEMPLWRRFGLKHS